MYKLNLNKTVSIVENGACIPADEGNRDYREYLAWVALGNIPLPADTIDPKLAVQAQIDTLETASIMNRTVREDLLSRAEAAAASKGLTQPQLYAVNIGYRKIKDLDVMIHDMRGKL